jgi:hypothetical protein
LYGERVPFRVLLAEAENGARTCLSPQAIAMAFNARLLLFVIFLMFVLAVHTTHSAYGQGAAPDFAPAAPITIIPGDFVPDANFATQNPAALQSGTPSRFGLGQIDSEVERDNGLGGTDKTNYDGYYAGLRWVSEVFAFGGEVVDLEDDDGDFEVAVRNAALAFPAAKILSVGLGLDTYDVESGGVSYEGRTPTVGIDLVLNEIFFIGLAMGREYQHVKVDQGDDYDSDRAVQTFGVGMRTGGRGGGAQFHLEYYVLQRDPHEDPANFEYDEQDQSHVVLEMIWSNILLSAHVVDFEQDTNDGVSEIFIVGWAPKKGLALAGQLERTASEDGGGAETNATTTTISIGYQF